MFMMWAIHALYQNPIYTGVAGAMFAAPMMASFIIGPFVDRWCKVAVLRISCFVMLIAVGVVMVAPNVFDGPGAWFMLFSILMFSIAAVFGNAAGTALLPQVVGGDDLVKANVMVQITGTVTGLAIGVVLYVLMVRGAAFELVYGVNAAVLLLGLVFSFGLRGARAVAEAEQVSFKAYFNELRAGLSFVAKGAMLPLVIGMIFMSFAADMAYVNLPMFAEEHLGTATGFIILSAIAMAGGVIGSYIGGVVAPKLALWKIFVMCFIAAGVARILFVMVIPDNFTRALLIHVLYAGLASTVVIFFRSLTQKLPPSHFVGRVTTLTASFQGVAAAFGALLGGYLGSVLPRVDVVFFIQGAAYIAIGLGLFVSGRVRGLPKIGDVVAEEGL